MRLRKVDMSLVLDRPSVTEADAPIDVVEVADLARDFCNGDERAMANVYAEHSSLVYSLCRRALGPERAADATQDVFFAAWKSRERFNPEAGSLAGWLVGITRFKIIDLQRVESRHQLAPEFAQDAEIATDSVGLTSMAQRMVIADALETLPARSRTIVEMAFFEDMTHHQISESSGLPLGTVKSDIRRGLLKLRHHLEGFDHATRS